MNKLITPIEGDTSTIIGRLALVVGFGLLGLVGQASADVVVDQWNGMERTTYTEEDIHCDTMSFYNNDIMEISDLYNLAPVWYGDAVPIEGMGIVEVFVFADNTDPSLANKYLSFAYDRELDIICLVSEGIRGEDT